MVFSHNSDMGGAKIYTSLESLGVSASAAPNDFLSAMAQDSVLMIENGTLTSPDWNFPNALSTLVIIKRFNGRVSIFLYGKEIANHDYRMFLNTDNTPSGEWYQCITNADLIAGHISSTSCPAGEITEINVTFDRAFTSNPAVTATLNSSSTSIKYKDLTITVTNVNKNGFTLLFFNGSDVTVAPAIDWIAAAM